MPDDAAIERIHEWARGNPEGAYIAAGLTADVSRKGKVLWACCPFHQERTPSFKIQLDGEHAGLWRCFGACGGGGDILSFRQRIANEDFMTAVDKLAEIAGHMPVARKPRPKAVELPQAMPRPIPHDAVVERHEALLTKTKYMTWLREKKGLDETAVRMFYLGILPEREAFTVPIPFLSETADGWADMRLYMPGRVPKFLPWLDYEVETNRGCIKLFGWNYCSEADTVVWVEGELDAMNLIVRGIPAMTATNGCDGALSAKFRLPSLAGMTVRIFTDADEKGDKLRAELPMRLRQAGARCIQAIRWPEVLPGGKQVPKGYDVSDYIRDFGDVPAVLREGLR